MDFDYTQQGADWPKKFPECARSQQSPINLLDPISSYGQAYSLMDAELDALTKTYGVAEKVLLKGEQKKVFVDLSA